MLKCGECTFLKEPDDGLPSCGHPEKPKADSEMIRICSYEADCQHGYIDIWAARGAARLIHMQEKPKKVDHTATTGVLNKQIVNQVGALIGMSMIGGLLGKWVK